MKRSYKIAIFVDVVVRHVLAPPWIRHAKGPRRPIGGGAGAQVQADELQGAPPFVTAHVRDREWLRQVGPAALRRAEDPVSLVLRSIRSLSGGGPPPPPPPASRRRAWPAVSAASWARSSTGSTPASASRSVTTAPSTWPPPHPRPGTALLGAFYLTSACSTWPWTRGRPKSKATGSSQKTRSPSRAGPTWLMKSCTPAGLR
uniref:FRIGIDA-like protein n=1 Tax=Setaria viridis TaxID=4556 RepID=A0A4U6T9S5_SETVI|nr:uncharacterized protein LOC117837236 [Setaria viridis]TKV98700.1 hypothetical protein SEVIR_9G576900v2 [Setaria viridis]